MRLPHHSLITSAALLLCSGAALRAQLPAAPVQDLPDHIESPFERTGLTQQFLSAESLGIAAGGTLNLDQIWLRYDGPSQSSSLLPHTLASLSIRIGSSRAISLTASNSDPDSAWSRIASTSPSIRGLNAATMFFENALASRARVRVCSGGSVS